jgi:hypothetical protein
METIVMNTTNNTNEINELNSALRAIRGVLETAINTKTVLNTDEIREVLGAVRGVLETITEPDENEVLIDTLFDDIETEKKESRTWNEPYFLDRTGASQELKEWADRTSESFFEEHSDIGNIHPDWTVVSVPTRFRDEVRALMEGNPLPYSPGMVVHPGVWYYPADREFEIVE